MVESRMIQTVDPCEDFFRFACGRYVEEYDLAVQVPWQVNSEMKFGVKMILYHLQSYVNVVGNGANDKVEDQLKEDSNNFSPKIEIRIKG